MADFFSDLIAPQTQFPYMPQQRSVRPETIMALKKALTPKVNKTPLSKDTEGLLGIDKELLKKAGSPGETVPPSGVAALIVAKDKGPGIVTPEDEKKMWTSFDEKKAWDEVYAFEKKLAKIESNFASLPEEEKKKQKVFIEASIKKILPIITGNKNADISYTEKGTLGESGSLRPEADIKKALLLLEQNPPSGIRDLLKAEAGQKENLLDINRQGEFYQKNPYAAMNLQALQSVWDAAAGTSHAKNIQYGRPISDILSKKQEIAQTLGALAAKRAGIEENYFSKMFIPPTGQPSYALDIKPPPPPKAAGKEKDDFNKRKIVLESDPMKKARAADGALAKLEAYMSLAEQLVPDEGITFNTSDASVLGAAYEDAMAAIQKAREFGALQKSEVERLIKQIPFFGETGLKGKIMSAIQYSGSMIGLDSNKKDKLNRLAQTLKPIREERDRNYEELRNFFPDYEKYITTSKGLGISEKTERDTKKVSDAPVDKTDAQKRQRIEVLRKKRGLK